MKTSRMKSFVAASLLALAATLTAGASAEEAAGDWNGLLGGQLHVIVHVTKDAAGRYDARLESPDQGSFVLPADEVVADAGHFSFRIPKIGGSFTGTWNAGKQAWVGTWSQGTSMPFALSRMTGATSTLAAAKRPQEDAIAAGPRPYRLEEVRFASSATGVTLAGTLSVPEGAGPFPAVVLIGGSGPGTRDEESFGHKPFLVLADALNRRGIAVLRYDKRGIGASTGDFATANLTDFAADAESALAFLKSRPGIVPDRIGLVGHSEGGVLAPMIAVRNPSARFVVLMAGPGMRLGRLLRLQSVKIAQASGVSDADIARRNAFYDKLYADLQGTRSDEQALAIVRTDVAQAVADKLVPAANADTVARQVVSPWARQLYGYDPIPTLRALKTPALFLIGSLDLYVPPEENLGPIRTALQGNAKATIVELPNLNHMFQTARAGTPDEFGEIEETIAPAALKTIVDWVEAQGAGPQSAG